MRQGSMAWKVIVRVIAAAGMICAASPGWAQMAEEVPEALTVVAVDFDGDGQVADWEVEAVALWQNHEGLSRVLAAAIANSPVSPQGVADISAYLNSLVPPPLPEATEEVPSEEGVSEAESASAEAAIGGVAAGGGGPTIPAWTCKFKRGDVNRDSYVNGTDYTCLTACLGGTYNPPNLDAADVNDDGLVNDTDLTYLHNYVSHGGPQPPAPLSSFGLDPTYDLIELPCQDQGDFEHARNSLETGEIALPPVENMSLANDMLPEGMTEPVDGTGGFGDLAPDLEVFPGPGNLAWGVLPSYRTRFTVRNNESTTFQFHSECGANWFSGIPHVVDAGSDASPRYWVRWSASCVRAYTASGSTGRFLNQTKLVLDAGNEIFVYDLAGRRYVFYGYGAAAKAVKGRIKRIEGLGGSGTSKIRVEFDWGDLKTGQLLAVIVRSEMGAECQTWSFIYGAGWSLYRITEVTMRRPDDTIPYRVFFRYWDDATGEVGGIAGDLMQVDVETDLSPAGQENPPDKAIVRSYYYRYFTDTIWSTNSPGYQHQVRFFCGPDACTYLDPATYLVLPNYSTQGDNLSDVADREYEYCMDSRLSFLRLRGQCCGSGMGLYSYTWYLGKSQLSGLASESHIMVEIGLPHAESVFSSRRILCFNPYGQKLVDARCVKEDEESTEVKSVSAAAYGTTSPENWHLRHKFWPSACHSFNPDVGIPVQCQYPSTSFTTKGNLHAYQVGSTGKHLEYSYAYYYTDALEIGVGLGQGTAATTLVSKNRYVTFTDTVNANRRRAVSSWSQFYESDGTPRQTAWTYTSPCADDSLIFQDVSRSAPIVTTAKNGSGSPVVERFWYDNRNMLVWYKNGAERVSYTVYDSAYDAQHPTPVTWLPSIEVADIDTAHPPAGVALGSIPVGFATSGTNKGYAVDGAERLNVATFTTYDGQCRRVIVDQAAGLADDNTTRRRRISRFLYAKLSGLPTQLSADKAVTLAYPQVEGGSIPQGEVQLTMYTPGGRIAGKGKALMQGREAPFGKADWQWESPPYYLEGVFPSEGTRHLLERSEYEYTFDESDGHRMVIERAWNDPEYGGSHSDYTVTRHYDLQGNLARIEGQKTAGQDGFRQIVRIERDPLGREREILVGSNDNDMVVVRHSYYDEGWNGPPELVGGDGHLTRVVLFPGNGSQQLTHNQYDWRGRRLRVWEGYDAQENVWRRVSHFDVDNQNREISAKTFADLQFVADLGTELNSTQLRAWREKVYDEEGRVYWETVHGVDPADGAPDEGGGIIPSYTNSWYGARGELVKRKDPDSTFHKSTYDGLGRVVKTFRSYDNSETAYADALTVDDDVVLEQVLDARDQVGNALITRSFARFSAGAGDGVLTATNARRSYDCRWFDIFGRVELHAFYGDYGGQPLCEGPNDPVRLPRPSYNAVTDATRMLTRYTSWDSYGPSGLNARHRRWAYTTAADGQVHGAEVDAFGRTVRAWTRGRDGDSCQVTDLQYDALDHVTARTGHQGGVLESELWDPLVDALPTTTGYVWGVKADGENLATLSGVLAAVHRPSAVPEDNGSPSEEAAIEAAYDALGRRIAVTQTRTPTIKSEIPGQPDTPAVKFHKHILRDVLGRIVKESVEDLGEGTNVDVGPYALAWDYDSLGRILKARSLDEDQETVLNEIGYEYDAWGTVTTIVQEHEGAISETSARITYTYQGPRGVGTGENAHAIEHRPVTCTVDPPVGFGVCTEYGYGTTGLPNDMLGRPESYNFYRETQEIEERIPYLVRETFMGIGAWIRSESQYKVGEEWVTGSVQEVTNAETSGSLGGFDRFGRAVKFKAWKDATTWPLRRELTYDPQTTQLVGINDHMRDSSVPSEIQIAEDDFTYDDFGGVTGHQHGHKIKVEDSWVWPSSWDTTSWIFDGVLNETCNSVDTGVECVAPETSREYNRRNEITLMEGDVDFAIAYDEAGRLTRLKHEQHTVDLCYFYDAWNRLAGYGASAEPPVVVFQYDAMGHLIKQGEFKHLYYDFQDNLAWTTAVSTTADLVNVWSIWSGRMLSAVQDSVANWRVEDPRRHPAGTLGTAGEPKERYWPKPGGPTNPLAAAGRFGGAGGGVGGGAGGGIGGFPAAAVAADPDSGVPNTWTPSGYVLLLQFSTGGQYIDTGGCVIGGGNGQWESTVTGHRVVPQETTRAALAAEPGAGDAGGKVIPANPCPRGKKTMKIMVVSAGKYPKYPESENDMRLGYNRMFYGWEQPIRGDNPTQAVASVQSRVGDCEKIHGKGCCCVERLEFHGHGDEGVQAVGDGVIRRESVGVLEGLRQCLCEVSTVAFLGCKVAKGNRGRRLLVDAARALDPGVTGDGRVVHVRASVDDTWNDDGNPDGKNINLSTEATAVSWGAEGGVVTVTDPDSGGKATTYVIDGKGKESKLDEP